MSFTDYLPYPIDHKFTMNDAKEYRNVLLKESDWSQLPDAPLTDAEKELWKAYRQLLRDIPQNYTDPTKVIWPTPPGGTNG
jgi:hypothetical protein